MTLTQANGQRALNGPSISKPSLYGLAVETIQSGQLAGCAGVTIEGVQPCASLIQSLRLRRGPSAIVRFVVAIGFTAINRMTRAWALAHVFVERLKGVEPALADGNTSAAVLLEVLPTWPRASVDHASPRPEFGGVGHAVCDRSGFELFGSQTSAGMRARQVGELNGGFVAAVASAHSDWTARVRAVNGEDGEPSVRVADVHNEILPYFAPVLAKR